MAEVEVDFPNVCVKRVESRVEICDDDVVYMTISSLNLSNLIFLLKETT